MQSIHCINRQKHAVYTLHKYTKKSLELIIHPFLPKKILYNRLLFWLFFFTFAPSEIENRNYE